MANQSDKRKIVFINQGFNYLTIDIINEFAREFDEVSVITGSVRVQDVPLDEKVKVQKIIRYNKKSLGKKFYTWLVGTLQIYFLILFKYRKHELFFISIPPFAYLLMRLLRNKFSILIWDVYPDTLKIYNLSEKNFVYRFWVSSNKKIFKRAHRLYTIGERMADLVSKYVDRDKLIIIPLWNGLRHIKPIAKHENKFALEHNLQDKFVVQYSGNIGFTHNVEVLVEVANMLKENKDIFFLIIGRGKRAADIKELISSYRLDNCMMLPFQPDDVLPYSLACADLGVVVLDDKTAQGSVPSKTYNLMAVGVPLLCIASKDSELADYIDNFDNGRIFASTDVDDIADFVEELSKNPEQLQKYKANSVAASANFTHRNAEQFLQHY